MTADGRVDAINPGVLLPALPWCGALTITKGAGSNRRATPGSTAFVMSPGSTNAASDATPNPHDAGTVTRRPRSNVEPGTPPASTSMGRAPAGHTRVASPWPTSRTATRVQPGAGRGTTNARVRRGLARIRAAL